jgi:integrase/recombinase XerC
VNGNDSILPDQYCPRMTDISDPRYLSSLGTGMRSRDQKFTARVPTAWRSAIDGWVRYTRTSTNNALTTIRSRREHLERCARTIGADDPWAVDGEWLYGWFDSQPWGRETQRSHRATLRAFYAWGAMCGLVEESPALWIPAIRAAKPTPHPTPEDGYWRAVEAAGARELLMLRIGVELGFRRGEIARCNTRDIIREPDGWALRAHGKGDRERIVPMPDDLARVLRMLPPGFFVPGADHGHLSPRWVGTLVSELLPPGYTTHSLRHLFATRTHASSGRDLLVVQRLLGHASVETTRIYIGEVETRLRDAVVAAEAKARPRPAAAVRSAA